MGDKQKKVEAQAKILAGFIYKYDGSGTLQQLWDNLSWEEKFMIFHQLHTIKKAGN